MGTVNRRRYVLAAGLVIWSVCFPVVQAERNDDTVISVGALPAVKQTLQGQPMLIKLNEAAPAWVYDDFRRLESAGLIPEAQRIRLVSLTRREGAMLTSRAWRNYKAMSTADTSQTMVATSQDRQVKHLDTAELESVMTALREEFADELAALGDGSKRVAKTTKAKNEEFWNWRVYGEIRYSYMHDSGSPGYRWNDSRWRFRMETVKAITDNWRIRALVESDTSRLSGDDAEKVHNSRKGKLKLSRLYGQGSYRWFNRPVAVEAGKAYAFLGDGNVLDTTFEGIKLAIKPTDSSMVYAGIGDVDDEERMQFAEAVYRRSRLDYLGGYYHWHNYGQPTSIYGGGGRYYLGNYMLGGMYLRANRADGSGDKDGFALTLRYGRNYSWVPGTYEMALSYYDLAGETYISHTMFGMGNRMNGFSGWGLKGYYTLSPTVMVGMHYYDVKDSTDGRRARTWWNEITFSF
ncbi:hypothetical protein [uncultured Veillonella sp.]|uniref:hypothetical protein n=1 Tax=uncultured Veillonella sp. TaxID=159268 RepID=UPI002597D945|nr:hypothetical protein [uncultured Veillonella sp.]